MKNVIFLVTIMVTNATIFSSENKNKIILEEPGLTHLKEGLNEMVTSGKKLDNWQDNKAVITYINYQERFNQAPQLGYSQVLNDQERKQVDSLWSKIKDTEEFFNAIDQAENQQTLAAWQHFKKIMAIEGMKILQRKGVKFQPNPSKETHADFLKINHDISDDAAQWLFPGSVMLYVAEQLMAENSKIIN